jgi:hypothetical protein
VGEKECKRKEIKNKNNNYKELLIILFDIKRLKKREIECKIYLFYKVMLLIIKVVLSMTVVKILMDQIFCV